MVADAIAPPTVADPFEITPVGLRLIRKPTFEEWVVFGRKLWSIRTAIQWCVGDWLVYGEGRGDWGETYAQAHEVTQYSEHTLANLAWVSDRVQISRRREDLSHSHHEAVAKLEPTTQVVVLQKAVSQKWSREDVREEANRIKPPRHTVPSPEPAAPLIVEPSPRPNSATFEATYIYADRFIALLTADEDALDQLMCAHPDAVVQVTVTWTEEAK